MVLIDNKPKIALVIENFDNTNVVDIIQYFKINFKYEFNVFLFTKPDTILRSNINFLSREGLNIKIIELEIKDKSIYNEVITEDIIIYINKPIQFLVYNFQYLYDKIVSYGQKIAFFDKNIIFFKRCIEKFNMLNSDEYNNLPDRNNGRYYLVKENK